MSKGITIGKGIKQNRNYARKLGASYNEKMPDKSADKSTVLHVSKHDLRSITQKCRRQSQKVSMNTGRTPNYNDNECHSQADKACNAHIQSVAKT